MERRDASINLTQPYHIALKHVLGAPEIIKQLIAANAGHAGQQNGHTFISTEDSGLITSLGATPFSETVTDVLRLDLPKVSMLGNRLDPIRSDKDVPSEFLDLSKIKNLQFDLSD